MKTKAQLREHYKELRQSLSQDQIENYSLIIANQTLKLDIWNHSFYHLFLSIAKLKEVNTDFILNILSGKDKHTVISKSNFKDGTMSHVLLSDDTILKLSAHGIPEPENGIFSLKETEPYFNNIGLTALEKTVVKPFAVAHSISCFVKG